MRTSYSMVVGAFIGLTGAVLLAPPLQAQQVVHVDLPAQPLGDALRTIGAETNTNVLFNPSLVRGLQSAPLSGSVSPEQAFRQLLAGTGLQHRYVDAHTVTLVAMQLEVSTGTARRDKNSVSPSSNFYLSDSTPVQLARADAAAAAVTEASSGSDSTGGGKDSSHAATEVIVTGTHIRGIENSTSPVIVLDKAYIDSTGITTTTRLIETLPQNFALGNQSVTSTNGITSFNEQGSSINLRGIGEGTTLVLLNGRRMAPGFFGSAVDISALPLSAIDRVEILTDGASAMYGSDAIGGVVNFILRRDYEGQETRLRAGTAPGNVDEYRLSHLAGQNWGSGNGLISLEYYKRDLLLASERSFVPSTSPVGSLLPKDENYSALFSGRQDLTEGLDGFADFLYTKRDSFNRAGFVNLNDTNRVRNPQLSATMGIDWRLAGDWQLEVSGNYASNDMERTYSRASTATLIDYDIRYVMRTAGVKADGAVLTLPGGEVRAAIGADWRDESLDSEVTASVPRSFDQTVRSAFGELSIPIVGATNALPAVRRLTLSATGRFDDYSSFGSSFDPQFGLMWEPAAGLRLRTSYGTSYKAPRLIDYDLSNNGAFAFSQFTDPGLSQGFSDQLWILGFSQNYEPQKSKSLSFGFEVTPSSLPGMKWSANYYNIRYKDQIAQPPTNGSLILGNPASYSGLFIRDPSAALVNQYIAIGELGTPLLAFNPDFSLNTTFDPSTIDVILDLRTRNLSEVKTSGVDLSLQNAFNVGASTYTLDLNGTYILERKQKVTANALALETVATIFNPARLRMRGSFGWQYAGWAAHSFLNYADSYSDNRTATAVPVASSTTVDARVAYDFDVQYKTGALSGVVLAASAQNLFDRDPPRTAVIGQLDMGFDATNGNPLGRLLVVEFTKTW